VAPAAMKKVPENQELIVMIQAPDRPPSQKR
jgi:hypothetical protein